MHPTVLTMSRTQGWNGDGAGRSPVPIHATRHVQIHPDELEDLEPVPPPRSPVAYVPPPFEPAEPSPTERHLKRALAKCAVENSELRSLIERAVALVERQRAEADAAARAAAAGLLSLSPATVGRLGPNSQVRVNRHGSVTITGALLPTDGAPPFTAPFAAEKGESHFAAPLDSPSGAGASAWGTFGSAAVASPAKRNLVDVPGQGVLDLLPGWKAAENTAADVEEDRYYFYNAVTKETLWDAPLAPPPSAAPSPPGWRAGRTGATRASAAASPARYQTNGSWVNGDDPDALSFSGRARRTGGDAPVGSVVLHEGEGSGVSPERRAYMQMQTGDAATQYATGNEGSPDCRPLSHHQMWRNTRVP